MPEDIANFKAHGADDVFVKPVRISRFDNILMKEYQIALNDQ